MKFYHILFCIVKVSQKSQQIWYRLLLCFNINGLANTFFFPKKRFFPFPHQIFPPEGKKYFTVNNIQSFNHLFHGFSKLVKSHNEFNLWNIAIFFDNFEDGFIFFSFPIIIPLESQLYKKKITTSHLHLHPYKFFWRIDKI